MGSRSILSPENFVSGHIGRAAFLSGAASSIIGLIALLGWIPGLQFLASPHPAYIPVAPLTAFALVSLGAIVSVHAIKPWRGGGRIFASAVSGLIAVYGLLTFTTLWNGVRLPVESFIYPVPKMIGGVPIARMSPATGVLFSMIGCGIFLVLLREGNEARIRFAGNLAGVLGSLAAAAGVTFLLGYMYGSPFLYGSGVIPVAVFTACGFVSLGTGVAAATGPDCIPLKYLVGPSARARLLRAFVPLTVFLVVALEALHGIVPDYFSANDALAAAMMATISAAISAFVVSRVATAVGRALDLAYEQRKRSEEALQRLAAAVEQTAEIIFITDTEGAIQYVNPAFERITGFGRQEAIGSNPRILKSGRHDEEFYRNLWETLKRGEVWTGGLINKRKDGSLYEEDAIISPVRDDAGRLMNFVAVKRDVTEERKMEEQLRQAQKIEAVGRLAGGVAHDFNNLLTAITGYSELAFARTAEGDPVHGYVKEIRDVAGRAAGLTRQLLAFSRRQILQPRIIDLNAVVRDIDRMLRRLIGEDIDLFTSLDPDLRLTKADPGQIGQVIMNLAVNARDAMPTGGKLTIETANVYIDEAYARGHATMHPGAYVMIAVSDTGVGMDQETLSRIFEPFFTTKEKGKGTGLGLSTVYGIVKQSGGHIWVYSEPGRGTTFKTYLPSVEETADVPEPAPEPKELIQGTETVLLAEDEEAVRMLALEILVMNGYTVLAAGDGEEALRTSARYEGKIDLMLCDVVMPGMSGADLSRKIALSRPDMKVLFMSGYTDNAIVHRGVLDPGTAFIEKPFSPDALARKVRAVLDAKKT
ncbi:MAG: PAS domain S-box protein [Deltaproteobacteria bacterium]|nr:PAS domain S-box protein [Deltaproteobacteria bacterium]